MSDDDAMMTELADMLITDTVEPHPAHIAALRLEAEDLSTRRKLDFEPTSVGSLPSRRWGWLAAAAALAVGLVAGVFASPSLDEFLFDSETPRGDAAVEYAGPLNGPAGQEAGRLQVSLAEIGRTIDLRTEALPVLPDGEYYEVWFVSSDDEPGAPDRISAGTFHPDPSGEVVVNLTAAVDPREYWMVEVTAEPGDGNPAATGPVVLRARLDE